MEESKGIWTRIKGFFLIVGAMLMAAKGTAALPAQHIVQNQQEQNQQEIKEKQQLIQKHKAVYPSQIKSLPKSMQSIPNSNKFR